jgi:hypothetical protein
MVAAIRTGSMMMVMSCIDPKTFKRTSARALLAVASNIARGSHCSCAPATNIAIAPSRNKGSTGNQQKVSATSQRTRPIGWVRWTRLFHSKRCAGIHRRSQLPRTPEDRTAGSHGSTNTGTRTSASSHAPARKRTNSTGRTSAPYSTTRAVQACGTWRNKKCRSARRWCRPHTMSNVPPAMKDA